MSSGDSSCLAIAETGTTTAFTKWSSPFNNFIDFYVPTTGVVTRLRPCYDTTVTTSMAYNAQTFPTTLGDTTKSMASNGYIVESGKEYVVISPDPITTWMFTDPYNWPVKTWAYCKIKSYVGYDMVLTVLYINGTAGSGNYNVLSSWPFLPDIQIQQVVIPVLDGASPASQAFSAFFGTDFSPVGIRGNGNSFLGNYIRIKLKNL
jgi:hypothetical protein